MLKLMQCAWLLKAKAGPFVMERAGTAFLDLFLLPKTKAANINCYLQSLKVIHFLKFHFKCFKCLLTYNKI